MTMFARRRDVLEREADRIGALAVRGDVTLPQDLERAVAKTIEAFGGLDILVWNSGGPPAGPGTDVTPDVARAGARADARSPPSASSTLALPHLEASAGGAHRRDHVARREGADAAISRSRTRSGPRSHGWLKTLADELGPKGITVNCVAPGRIATARLAYLYPDGPTEEALEDIPLRRWGEPREFGDVVCFLASDRARYVSGQTIVVDGGLQRALF